MANESATVHVSGSRLGVIVTGMSADEVRRAIKLLKSGKRAKNGEGERIRKALKFYDVSKKFFKNGGAFKRFKKKTKAGKSAKKAT